MSLRVRVFAGLAVFGLIALNASPAEAGTLTAATFTANGAYATTGASNTAYNWSFKTATSNTLGSVLMGLPAGTSAVNTPTFFDYWDGSGGNLTTPDSAATSITGSLDLRAKVDPDGWASWGDMSVIAKFNGTTGAYRFFIDNNGEIAFLRYKSGNVYQESYSNVVGGVTGTPLWIRVTFDSTTGTVTFYKSADGSSWTSLGLNPGATITSGASVDDTLPLIVGGDSSGSSYFAGKIYWAEVRNGINGTVVAATNPSLNTSGSTTWTAATGETWTLNRTGSAPYVDVAAPLTVTASTVLPSNGLAYMRLVDRRAAYRWTGTSVGANVTCSLSLLGFKNTSTAGSYTSLISTYTADPNPLLVDSATSSAQAFTDANGTTTVNVTIDPELVFSVAGRSSACNSQAPTAFSTSSSSNSVLMGSMSPVKSVGGAQDLTLTTNAGQGGIVYIRSLNAANALRDSRGNSIADVSGTHAAPGTAPTAGTAGFGYTTNDSAVGFAANKFAKLTTANDSVLVSTTAETRTSCVGFQAAAATSTVSGAYTATIIYTAVPSY